MYGWMGVFVNSLKGVWAYQADAPAAVHHMLTRTPAGLGQDKAPRCMLQFSWYLPASHQISTPDAL